MLSILSFFFIFTVSSIPDDNSFPCQQLPTTTKVSWQAPKILQNKGFTFGTLIKTPCGYEQIQNLKIGDIVCTNHNNQTTTITDIFCNDVHQCIRLTIDEITFNVGYEQKFLSADGIWIDAFAITLHDIFVDHEGFPYSFDTIEFIQQDLRTYTLTVDHHVFIATELDLVTHNSAAIIAPSIILSCIELIQPVITILGVTTSLYYFSSYAQPLQQGNFVVYQASPEKIYFDTRYQQLCKLKQEFLTLHAALKTIKSKFQDQAVLLNYQQLYNNTFTQTYNITAQYEATLDFEDRFELTEIRQKILDDLEEEICNIQIALGLFVNEMIHRKDKAIEYYNTITTKADPIHYMLKLPNNITYQAICTYYLFTAICNMMLEEIDNCNQECLLVSKCLNLKSDVLQKTTNIIQALQQTHNNIASYQQAIEKTKLGNQVKMQNVAIYFKQNIKLPYPNINQQLSNAKKDLYQYLQKNQSKSTTQSYLKIKPPKKPDDDDDDENPREYIDAKYHGKNATAKKSAAPKNGQAALDFSLSVGLRRRVGISENQIVILARTRIKPEGGSEWHGYATTWDDLKQDGKDKIRKILKDFGLVDSKGKIL